MCTKLNYVVQALYLILPGQGGGAIWPAKIYKDFIFPLRHQGWKKNNEFQMLNPAARNEMLRQKTTGRSRVNIFNFVSGSKKKKIVPKKATRNVTLAALLIEEVTRTLTNQ